MVEGLGVGYFVTLILLLELLTTGGIVAVAQQIPPDGDKLRKLFLCCNPTPPVEGRSKNAPCFENNGQDFTDNPNVWSLPGVFMSTNDSTTFLLEAIQELPCSHGLVETSVSSDEEERLPNPNRNIFYPNGYLRVDKEFYAPDEFCIQRISLASINLKLCPPDCGKTRACIPKCCSLDKVYSVGVTGPRGCTTHTHSQSFNPPLYKDYYTPTHNPTHLPHYFLWKLRDFRGNCVLNKTTLFPLSTRVATHLSSHFNSSFHPANFRFREDGGLLYRNEVDKKCSVELEPKRFLCFDGVQDFGGVAVAGMEEEEYIVHLCTSWKVEHFGRHETGGIYGVLLLAASIFPLMTSGVYCALWRKQSVHGWTIAATTGALFLMYLFQGTALILGDLHGREGIEDVWGCRGIAIVGNFSFLAAFSWMTVMCCDLWLTFRSITPNNRRSKGQTRYLKYSIFGWGLPTVFVGTGLTLDNYYASDDCTSHIVPGYGQLNCWLLPGSLGLYNYYPVAVLLALNLFFFAVTCIKLLRYRANTRFSTKTDADHWKGFTRFTKLLLIMGVTWVFELISWSIDGQDFKWYWVIFDIINILRAVAVFVVYVCKPDILQMLEEKHPTLKKLFRPFKRRCSNDLTDATGSTTTAGGGGGGGASSPRILDRELSTFR